MGWYQSTKALWSTLESTLTSRPGGPVPQEETILLRSTEIREPGEG